MLPTGRGTALGAVPARMVVWHQRSRLPSPFHGCFEWFCPVLGHWYTWVGACARITWDATFKTRSTLIAPHVLRRIRRPTWPTSPTPSPGWRVRLWLVRWPRRPGRRVRSARWAPRLRAAPPSVRRRLRRPPRVWRRRLRRPWWSAASRREPLAPVRGQPAPDCERRRTARLLFPLRACPRRGRQGAEGRPAGAGVCVCVV